MSRLYSLPKSPIFTNCFKIYIAHALIQLQYMSNINYIWTPIYNVALDNVLPQFNQHLNKLFWLLRNFSIQLTIQLNSQLTMFFTYFVLTVTTIVFKFCATFARLSVGIAQNGLSLSLIYTLMFSAKSRGAITMPCAGHKIFNS